MPVNRDGIWIPPVTKPMFDDSGPYRQSWLDAIRGDIDETEEPTPPVRRTTIKPTIEDSYQMETRRTYISSRTPEARRTEREIRERLLEAIRLSPSNDLRGTTVSMIRECISDERKRMRPDIYEYDEEPPIATIEGVPIYYSDFDRATISFIEVLKARARRLFELGAPDLDEKDTSLTSSNPCAEIDIDPPKPKSNRRKLKI